MNKFKLFAISAGAVVAGLVAGVAHASGPIITIASSTPTDLLAYVGQLFTDTSLIWLIAIGVPLGFYVIRRVIALIPKGK